ncbi:uncharacterized protein K02A2.6-like [Copidosoma floridanum]|uniref:uncharacterized protein K02A2.6-like n=1 Tax=Copidosoma floridanum TaxID=29053 RepID=UPI000C6FAD85|nr:uncharacterized protein K02A2.6-like [Copidosoma floridanum]
MKGLARGHCWWPNISHDIENLVKSCELCQSVRNNPNVTEKHVWWPEVYIVKNMLADTTINICKEVFARFGNPSVLVFDNGRTFTSNDFKNFLKENGITHKCTAPYHPATNGQAEKFVQTIKLALKKCKSTQNLQADLQKILAQYRTMPHTGTGVTPAELLFGRQIRCKLDLLKLPENHKYQDVNVDKKCKKFEIGERKEIALLEKFLKYIGVSGR